MAESQAQAGVPTGYPALSWASEEFGYRPTVPATSTLHFIKIQKKKKSFPNNPEKSNVDGL